MRDPTATTCLNVQVEKVTPIIVQFKDVSIVFWLGFGVPIMTTGRLLGGHGTSTFSEMSGVSITIGMYGSSSVDENNGGLGSW
jgi:hypothetical protein